MSPMTTPLLKASFNKNCFPGGNIILNVSQYEGKPRDISMADDKKRQRPDGTDDGDVDVKPNPSKRNKRDKDEEDRRTQDEGLTLYIANVSELARRYVSLTASLIGQTSISELRFPVLPMAHNGQGIAKLYTDNVFRQNPPQRIQIDSLLGVAGFVYTALHSYEIAKDRFEEYTYRYPEFHSAFIKDAQAAAWIFYFNRAFKVHQDVYRSDKAKGNHFEYPCPPQYMNKKDEWMKRVEDVLSLHGSLADAFPGYGYQNWPATRIPSNEGVQVRYYGTPEEFKESETQRKLTTWVIKNLHKAT